MNKKVNKKSKKDIKKKTIEFVSLDETFAILRRKHFGAKASKD